MGDRAVAPIKFDDQQASGLDQLAGAPPLMVNTLTDLAGTRKMRPGISVWSGFPTTIPDASPVDAMTPFGDLLIYATRDRKLWACDAAGAVEALSDNTTATQIDGVLPPVLVPFRTKVIAVGGGAPQSTTGTGLSAVLAGSPPNLASAVGIATRIVGGVNDTSGRFQWSGLGDSGHTTWDALNYSEAEAKPDELVSVATNTNELFAFGVETLQVFSPDPSVAFAPGRTLNIGLSAQYSLLSVDDQFAFLDRERRFVITDGRSFSDDVSVLSKPIEASLLGLSTVVDCWGFRMRTDRWDSCVWMFPTDGKGFIWNRRNRGWSEWRGFGENGYQAPTITSAVHWPEQNAFLVGLETGQIAKLDASAFTDLGDTIKVELISGFEDHGSSNLKKCISVKFTFKRGQTEQSGTAPVVAVSYRDDLGAFGAPKMLSLGLAGDYAVTSEIRSAGSYRRRQWKVEFTSNADFTLVGAVEEFETLAN